MQAVMDNARPAGGARPAGRPSPGRVRSARHPVAAQAAVTEAALDVVRRERSAVPGTEQAADAGTTDGSARPEPDAVEEERGAVDGAPEADGEPEDAQARAARFERDAMPLIDQLYG